MNPKPPPRARAPADSPTRCSDTCTPARAQPRARTRTQMQNRPHSRTHEIAHAHKHAAHTHTRPRIHSRCKPTLCCAAVHGTQTHARTHRRGHLALTPDSTRAGLVPRGCGLHVGEWLGPRLGSRPPTLLKRIPAPNPLPHGAHGAAKHSLSR